MYFHSIEIQHGGAWRLYKHCTFKKRNLNLHVHKKINQRKSIQSFNWNPASPCAWLSRKLPQLFVARKLITPQKKLKLGQMELYKSGSWMQQNNQTYSIGMWDVHKTDYSKFKPWIMVPVVFWEARGCGSWWVEKEKTWGHNCRELASCSTCAFSNFEREKCDPMSNSADLTCYSNQMQTPRQNQTEQRCLESCEEFCTPIYQVAGTQLVAIALHWHMLQWQYSPQHGPLVQKQRCSMPFCRGGKRWPQCHHALEGSTCFVSCTITRPNYPERVPSIYWFWWFPTICQHIWRV